MKIRILFYRAERDGHPLDDIISLWTGLFNWGTGPYSHVELWVPDEVHGFELINKAIGYCYTSTMRGDTKGVVKNPASKILKYPKRWDVCEIEIDEADNTYLVNVANMAVKTNQGYDFKAIMSFFWYKRAHNPLRYICSELVYRLLVCAKVLNCKKNKCPSPRRLSRWLTKRGYKITPLLP